jgi:hypothetical protein
MRRPGPDSMIPGRAGIRLPGQLDLLVNMPGW